MSAKEIWLTIKHNNNYEVSNLGNVRNKKTKRILKPAISNKGYYLVSLSKNCKQHSYTIHKLVMEHFNRCAFDNEVINHKDHNKLNNELENLEYITQKENVQDAYNNGLCENVRKQATKNILKASEQEKIKINQYDLKGNFIREWESITQASKELNNSLNNISQCCLGRSRTSKGYIFRFKDDKEILSKYKESGE